MLFLLLLRPSLAFRVRISHEDELEIQWQIVLLFYLLLRMFVLHYIQACKDGMVFFEEDCSFMVLLCAYYYLTNA